MTATAPSGVVLVNETPGFERKANGGCWDRSIAERGDWLLRLEGFAQERSEPAAGDLDGFVQNVGGRDAENPTPPSD